MLLTHRNVRSTGRFWKSLLLGELTQFGNALEHICPNDITREAIFAKKKTLMLFSCYASLGLEQIARALCTGVSIRLVF